MTLLWRRLGNSDPSQYALYTDGAYAGHLVIPFESDGGCVWLCVNADSFIGPARIVGSRVHPDLAGAQAWVEAHYKEMHGHETR